MLCKFVRIDRFNGVLSFNCHVDADVAPRIHMTVTSRRLRANDIRSITRVVIPSQLQTHLARCQALPAVAPTLADNVHAHSTSLWSFSSASAIFQAVL